MTQQCLPCRGIQRLTPVPIFNRPGLSRLGYRLGNYAEFFESMLAALSDAGATAGRPETVARALDQLRTRDPDDPSIALLDAWALVADVLTFYQERVANEAFLNTAMQPGSLHELSRLLGYEPRPGLSSSVLLSFEVDDRSDEVIIPAGTPAKSTPVPGSGDQPQTFETSERFVARADWNMIRPRLTEPQQLQGAQLAELERVYVKGRGLRIEPNDWLAIGNAESLATPELKQVRAVEERTNPMDEQVTVLHLVVDPLSVVELLKEIGDATDEFFTKVKDKGLFEDAAQTEFDKRKTIINNLLNELRVIRFGKGLIYVDQQLQQRLLIQEFFEHTGDSVVNLREYMDQLVTDIENIKGRYSYSVNSPVSRYQAALTAYQATHATVLGDFVTPWKQAVNLLDSTPTSAANRLAIQNALFWTPILGTPTATRPDLLIGIDSTVATVADNGNVFRDIEAARHPTSSITEYEIKLEVTDGIGLNALTDTATDVTDLNTKLDGFTRNSNAPGEFASYIHYVINDDDGTTPRLLTAGVHVVKTVDTHTTYFNNLGAERVLVYPAQVSSPVPVGLLEGTNLTFSNAVVAMADPDLSFDVDIIYGGGTLSSITSPLKIGDLNTALKNLTYTPPDVNDHRVVIKLTISGPNATGVNAVRAIAIRTLFIDSGKRFVRGALAGSLNTPGNVAALKSTLTGTETALTNIGAQMAHKHALKNSVESNKSISDAVLRADLRLDAMNGVLDTAIGAMKTQLTGYANHPKFAFISTNASSENVVTVAGLIPDNSASSTTMVDFEDHYETCKNLLENESAAVKALRGGAADPPTTMYGLANSIKDSLYGKRSLFIGLLKRAKTDHETKFDNAKPPDKSAKDALDELFLASGNVNNSLAFRAKEFAKTLDSNSTAVELTNTKSTIEELYKLATDILADKPAVSDLSTDAKDAVSLIKARWEGTRASVSGFGTIGASTAGTDPTITSAQDILRRLLVNRGQLSVADAFLVLRVLNEGSNLWTQVNAALNPDRRSDILAGFRDFRNVSLVPRVDVWVFRSQANVFGWNSPGKLETKTILASPPPPAGPTPETQVVMVRDSKFLKPVNEAKDQICLDGKLEDTLAGTPIGIRRENDDDPQPFWIERVSFAPRTEYELSGDTTKVKLRTEWWTDLPTHSHFQTIRKTKVWCNAERLKLAESILSDDTQEFRVPELVNSPILELNQFLPYLSAGMQVVVSGIPAPEALPPDNRRPTREDPDANIHSEVATIVSVFHNFDDTLYDDPVRTTVALLQPLQRTYWRDTLRIAANIVPATHGETIRERIGSGDARHAFQKFTLSKSPLTRLSAADADGQEPQLDVRVNNVRWQPVDRLLELDQQAEAYEIQSTRTAVHRIQFGDGVNGSRVPTGQDNVQATYRTGIGRAGNVESDRIDQLPSPPLGVRGVSNPVPGEGGADSDTVRQTKPRIPRAPIRAARLISARDYESFALLFAGVDKAKAIVEQGAVRLIIAGMEPGPLREDGSLLQSLKQAIDRFADPNVPVIVAPHSGKLLFVQATLNIDERADWETVKEAAKQALVQRFGYADVQLGQAILASDVVNTIQQVEYVRFVRLEKLYGFTTENARQSDPGVAVQAQSRVDVAPDELCYVAGSVDNTVVLGREL